MAELIGNKINTFQSSVALRVHNANRNNNKWSRHTNIENSLLVEKVSDLELTEGLISNYDLLPRAPEELDSHDARNSYYMCEENEGPYLKVLTNRVEFEKRRRNYVGTISTEFAEGIKTDWKSWFNQEHVQLTSEERGSYFVYDRKILIEKKGNSNRSMWDEWEDVMSYDAHVERWETHMKKYKKENEKTL